MDERFSNAFKKATATMNKIGDSLKHVGQAKEEENVAPKVEREAKKAAPKRGKVLGKKIVVSIDSVLPDPVPKDAQAVEFLLGALSGNFIFSALDDKEIGLLVDVMQKEVVEEGATIIRQGDVGDFFYVVECGTINFIINEDMHVGSCTRGGSFGELALLYDAPRAATCVAETDSILWKVDQNTFRFLLAKNADMIEKATSSTLKQIPLFQNLSETTLQKFADALSHVKFKEGDRIMTKGEEGHVFYLIDKGKVRIHDIGHGTEHVDNILGPKQWFGERALLTGEPRAASATAHTDVVLLSMERATFESAIGSLEESMKFVMKKNILEALPVIANSELTLHEIDKLVDQMTHHSYKKGEKLAEVGKLFMRQIIMIRHGKVSVFSESGDIHTLMDGDVYGGQTVQDFRGTNSPDTVVCDEDTECYVLRRKEIEAVIGDIHRLGKHGEYVDTTEKTEIGYNDIIKHRALGQGAFGLVYLVSLKGEEPRKPYALKMMSKRELIEAKMVQGTLREKQILASLNHPFILPMIAAFQDEDHLYLLLQLIQGGELFNVIHRDPRHRYLPNDAAVFYAACVLDALSHFHTRLICYRDLKPENILVDGSGYCVMVDLGFAKIVTNKTFTMCGTPEYLAPEIITSKGHNKAVDWWAFGVLIYEMLVGKSPFYRSGDGQLQLFKNIVKLRYKCPEHLHDDAKQIISKLLIVKQTARLGNLANADVDIREQGWFKDVSFRKLLEKRYTAPWLPKVKDAFDASNFENIRPHSQGRKRKITKEEQVLFKDF